MLKTFKTATNPCGRANEEDSLLATHTKVRDITVERARRRCQRWCWWHRCLAWWVINTLTTNSEPHKHTITFHYTASVSEWV